MTGLISSIKSMGSVLLVTVLVLIVFAVIGVDIFRVGYNHIVTIIIIITIIFASDSIT